MMRATAVAAAATAAAVATAIAKGTERVVRPAEQRWPRESAQVAERVDEGSGDGEELSRRPVRVGSHSGRDSAVTADILAGGS